MSFTGEENHDISLEEAAKLTARFRASVGADAKIGGFFGNRAIMRILNQDGCVGIRYYYGLDSHSNPVLVLVGVDAHENDMEHGELAELSLPCPHMCSIGNQLNGGV
jgi:hypothetical protein